MSALGKLSRYVGRSAKQSTALLLEGSSCIELQTLNASLIRCQRSQSLHQAACSSVTLKPYVLQTNPSRSFFWNRDKNVEIDPESKLPLTHPTKGMLVYYGRWSKYTKQVKILSLSTSLIALGAQPLILAAAKDDRIFKAGLMATLSTCLFATPVIVHFVTKKYVTDIYYNEETKTFTLATRNFFLRRKELEYKAGDVEFPFVPRAFVTHLVKGKSYFIAEEEFRGVDIYKHMVGFDKPFQLNSGKKKKFGLFEDEKDRKVVAQQSTYVPSQIAFYDDDDDDLILQQKLQQQKEEQRLQQQKDQKINQQ